MTLVFDFSAHISKNVANPLGLRLKDLSFRVCYSVRMLYDVADRDRYYLRLPDKAV